MHARGKEHSMNINAISNVNFRAHINDDDYYMGKVEEFLYENHGVGADELLDFRAKLAKLPDGRVEIDDFVNHANRSYIFGTLYPSCNHKKPFVVETADSENLLQYMIDTLELTFKEKSRHPECPICNPTEEK